MNPFRFRPVAIQLEDRCNPSGGLPGPDSFVVNLVGENLTAAIQTTNAAKVKASLQEVLTVNQSVYAATSQQVANLQAAVAQNPALAPYVGQQLATAGTREYIAAQNAMAASFYIQIIDAFGGATQTTQQSTALNSSTTSSTTNNSLSQTALNALANQSNTTTNTTASNNQNSTSTSTTTS